VVHELAPPRMDVERARREGRIRRYEVCDDHNADYFGRGRFLSMEQLERIRMDMVPAQVHVIPGTPTRASVTEREPSGRVGSPRTVLPSARDARSVRGRSSYTAAEVAEIKQILSEKQTAPRDRQKALRAKLRKRFRFYISEHAGHRPFVEADFDELIQRGTITVVRPGGGRTAQPTTSAHHPD
jgi:hypothetical protein